MKTSRWLLVGLAAACLAGGLRAAENELSPAEKGEGWKLLFNGRNLDGWKTTGKMEGWTVEDGAIACLAMGGGYLYTPEQYGNFRFSVEYKIAPKTNSGIFFRWSDLKDPVNTGIEAQVIDSHGKETPGKHDDGALYDLIAPAKNASKPAGEWNHAVITCRDSLVSIELNGEKVSEMDLDRWTEAGKNPDGTKNKFKYAYKELPRKGHLGFQDHGGRVWFRNVKIQELK